MDWEVYLANLFGVNIRWRQQWKEVRGIICQCRGFPNIPLLGTKGVINCNPIISLRQMGYPLRGSPADEVLTPIFTRGSDDEGLISKVKVAWKYPMRENKELGKNNIVAGSYAQWLKDRDNQIGLPCRHQ